MIANDIELQRTRTQVAELETVISDLKHRVLAINPERFRLMSESYLNEIETLRDRIDEYLGIKAVRELSSDFLLKIESPLLSEGMAPAVVVNRAISGLQRGLQKLGEFVVKAKHGFGINIPSHVIAQEFNLEIVAVTAGSFEVGLRVSSRGRVEVPPESFNETIQMLADTVTHISHRDADPELLTELLPDLSSQFQVLHALREIAPSNRRRDITVALQTRLLGDQFVRFDADTKKYLGTLIRTRRREAAEIGIIREVDLDKKTFKLRTATTMLRCRWTRWDDNMMANALDRRAQLYGTAQVAPDGKVLTFSAIRVELL